MSITRRSGERSGHLVREPQFAGRQLAGAIEARASSRPTEQRAELLKQKAMGLRACAMDWHRMGVSPARITGGTLMPPRTIACKQAPPPMVRFIAAVFCFLFAAATASAAESVHDICVLVGAAGENEYATGFAEAAQAWQQAAARGGAACTTIGLGSETKDPDREQLRRWIAARSTEASTSVWIAYLGHGTFDGREARLNLRGPDLTARELASWLAPLRRPVIFIHGGSGGAPFIPALSGPDRIIITATRSGHELNYARFGERFAHAVANPSADIDQDGQTSVLEAFVTAAQQVQAFYAEAGRLATEHALIDDNGDKQGTPAEWFRGGRLQRRPEGRAEPDGRQARLIALVPSASERALTPAQRAQRDELEHAIETLRTRKSKMPEDDYYRALEHLFRRLGELYHSDT